MTLAERCNKVAWYGTFTAEFNPLTNHANQNNSGDGNKHGIAKGWFCWPLNFDPTWLESCDGFEKKGGEAHESTDQK